MGQWSNSGFLWNFLNSAKTPKQNFCSSPVIDFKDFFVVVAPLLASMSVAGVVRIVKRPVAGSRLPSRAPITLSQAAISRLHTLMPKEKPLAGVRLGVKTRGCSGLSYTLDWAEKKEKNDEVVEAEGLLTPPPFYLNTLACKQNRPWINLSIPPPPKRC